MNTKIISLGGSIVAPEGPDAAFVAQFAETVRTYLSADASRRLIFIVGGVFVMEAASVMLQVLSFKLFKKRIFRMAPLHHHFELKGWTETQVVVRFWILGGLFSLISLITLKVQ